MRCEGHNTNNVDRCDDYTTPLDYVKVFSTGPFSNFSRRTIDITQVSMHINFADVKNISVLTSLKGFSISEPPRRTLLALVWTQSHIPSVI